MRLASPLDLTMRPTHTRRGLSGKPVYTQVLSTYIQEHTVKHTNVLLLLLLLSLDTPRDNVWLTHILCAVFSYGLLRILSIENILLVSSDTGQYGNLITSILSAKSLKNKSSSAPTFSLTMQPCLQFHTKF